MGSVGAGDQEPAAFQRRLKSRVGVLFALDTASNDPRVSVELRKDVERVMRNLKAVARSRERRQDAD